MKTNRISQSLLVIGLFALLLAACSITGPRTVTETLAPSATALPTGTALPSSTPLPSETPLPATTATTEPSPTATVSPTILPTETVTLTPTVALTPTPERPIVTAKMQANCRYGPGVAYLYRWGLYAGDKATVLGRNWNGTWLWIQPHTLESGAKCWASEIVLNEKVEKSEAPFVQIPLPRTTFAGPPGNVKAARDGNQVTVSWDKVDLSDDKRRGYLIEARVCQNQAYFPFIIQTDETSYTFKDEPGCKEKSGGLLYTAEKHGYSEPVTIPWP